MWEVKIWMTMDWLLHLFLNVVFEPSQDELGLDSLSASFGSRGLDEKTEIILAATFLVLIILAFIR